MTDRYPLESARALREAELDEARAEVGRRTEQLDAAERDVTRAWERVEAHRLKTREVDAAERREDARGRVADEMLRTQAFLRRRAMEEAALLAAAREAEAARRRAEAALEASRVALAEARAARQAVERHYEKWQAEKRRVADSRAEAEQDDLVAARHRRS